MKVLIQMGLLTMLMNIAILTPRCPAYPTGRLLQNHSIAPTPPKALYYITLSLNSKVVSPDHDIPPLTVSLVNPTQQTLIFRWTSSRDVVYSVDYKEAADTPNGSPSWKQIMPKTLPSTIPRNQTDIPSNSVVTHGSDYSIVEEILPGQQFDGLGVPLNFSLSKPGFYRITAVMLIHHAAEFKGVTMPSSLILSSSLELHSLPLIIHRNHDGFTQIDDTTRKQLSLK